MPGKILNLKKTGEILGVTDRTVENLIERGLLRGFRVGARWRVEEAEITAYIERQKDMATAIEERQPGALDLIAQAHNLITDQEEREELDHLVLELLAANPGMKARLEETGLVIGLQEPITVTVDEEKRLIAEKKIAELAAARR
jgi:excisionase family DNA binding protein